MRWSSCLPAQAFSVFLYSGALRNLKKLSCSTSLLQPIFSVLDRTLPILQSITHLELDRHEQWTDLSTLSNLTHLSLIDPLLRVCLIFSQVYMRDGHKCDIPGPQSNLVHDPRIIFGCFRHQVGRSTAYKHWVVERPGIIPSGWVAPKDGLDIWEMAENVVALRKGIVEDSKKMTTAFELKLKLRSK